MNTQAQHQKYEFLSENPNIKVKPIVISLILGAFFATLNETLLNIALTTLMKEFSITLSAVQWITTGFMLVMGTVIPISALLIQWFTTRQMFLGTMIVFTVGTVICAIAPNFGVLLSGRFLQAIGTGLLTPVIFNVFLLMFPPKRRGAIMGLVGLVFMFAPAIGPTLSGVIVEYLGWRCLFIIVIPFVLFSILFAFKYLVNVSEVTKPKIDIQSIILSCLGFGGIVFGFSVAGTEKLGFLSPLTYIPIIIGIIGLVTFSIRQFKLKEPILDLRVFQFPMYRKGVFIFLIIMMAMLASEVLLPMYMQGSLALSAATAGLVLLPGSLLNGLMSPVTGMLFDKFGPRRLIIPALGLLCITLFILSRITLVTPVWLIVVSYAMLMIAISAAMMPVQTNSLNELPKKYYAHGTAILTTLQPVSGAIGVSVFVSILNGRQSKLLDTAADPGNITTIREAFVGGLEWVYTIALILAVVAFLVALFIKRALPEEVPEEE